MRKPQLDIMRAGALLYIIGFWHLISYSQIDDTVKTDFAGLICSAMLGIFFLLSSMMLTEKYGHIRSKAEIKEFIYKRVARLYPLYLVSLTCLYGMDIGELTHVDYVIGLFSAGIVFDNAPWTLWFVNVILFYYALMPLLWRANSSTLATITILALIVYIVEAEIDILPVDIRVIKYAPAFLAGIVFSRYDKKIMLTHPLVVIGSALLCFISVWLHDSSQYVANIITSLIAVIAYPLYIYLCELAGKHIYGLNKLSKMIAYAGLAAYLFHRHIYHLFLVVIPEEIRALRWASESAPYAYVIVLLTLIMSYFIQKSYDKLSTHQRVLP